MKLNIVDAIAGLLGGMKLNRIPDKDVKTDLVNNYLHLRKCLKGAREEAEEFRNKFRDDWSDEMFIVERLRAESQPLDGHEEYLDAERDANKALQDLFATDVEVDIHPVPLDAFVAACEGEELTLEQIAFLQDNGLIEE